MRSALFATALFGIALFGLPSLALAQPSPCDSLRSAFDPYNPSHLAVLRQYGGTALSRAPLSELLKLNPYNPVEAQLLREVGGGLPLWGFPWYPAYAPPVYLPDCNRVRPSSPPVLGPFEEPPSEPIDPPITTVAELVTALERERPSSATPTGRGGSPPVSVDRNAGVSIEYSGRRWTSAGRAVAFDDAAFVRVGAIGTTPVFRRRDSKDEIVYVPTIPGVVAPFRAAPR